MEDFNYTYSGQNECEIHNDILILDGVDVTKYYFTS